MKPVLHPLKLLLAVACLLVLGCNDAAGDLSPGGKAPDFALTDMNGKLHKLSDYLGKIVVLEWTNHECPYVRKHYDTGNMQALQEKATGDGVIWLTIVSSAPGEQGYLTITETRAVMEAEKSRETARLMDPGGEVGRRYGAKTTPHMYVINKDGELVYIGAIDDQPSVQPSTIEGAHNYVQAALTALASGAPVEISQTQPYGCAVKY